MQTLSGPNLLVDCPTRLATEILADKWAALVLFALHDGELRHGEILERIGGVSRKVLTDTLRRLGGYGLLERHEISARNVSYALTPVGESLIEPIETLTRWARDYGGDVADAELGSEEHDG